jgi:hypothetical protein
MKMGERGRKINECDTVLQQYGSCNDDNVYIRKRRRVYVTKNANDAYDMNLLWFLNFSVPYSIFNPGKQSIAS